MKIILVTAMNLSVKGAGVTHIKELTINLRNLGHQVHVFAPFFRDIKKDTNIFKRIPYVDLPFVRTLSFLFFLFFILIYHILKNGADVICTRQEGILIVPVIVSCFMGKPHISEVNGIFAEEAESFLSKLYILIVAFVERISYTLSNKIIAVTPGIKNYIEAEYNISRDKIIVVSNGANVDLFKPMSRDLVRAALGGDKNEYWICFVGHFSRWQGLACLVYCASLVLQEMFDTKFLLVGSSTVRQNVQYIHNLVHQLGLEDNFIFTGFISYEEVPTYVNASDVCVVPKKPMKSGFSPLKLYECMACEKPVVATRTDGFEILEDHNAGLLVEPENPEEFAEAIVKLLKNTELREKMGRNGRKYVVKNHSWEIAAKKVAKVCQDAIREYKRS